MSIKRFPLVPRVTNPLPHHFKKTQEHHVGRAKGTPNRTTTILKEAILLAAAAVGADRKGKGELVGYLTFVAIEHPLAFCKLLEKVLPLQITGSVETRQIEYTMQEAMAQLKERGIEVTARFDAPVPVEDLPLDASDFEEPSSSSSIN